MAKSKQILSDSTVDALLEREAVLKSKLFFDEKRTILRSLHERITDKKELKHRLLDLGLPELEADIIVRSGLHCSTDYLMVAALSILGVTAKLVIR